MTFVHLLSCSLPRLNFSPLFGIESRRHPPWFFIEVSRGGPTYFLYTWKNISNYKALGLKGFTW